VTIALRPDVCATDTQDGMVLLDEANGRYWQLNSTAALVLHALLDGATPQEAASRLAECYPQLAAERAIRDVQALLTALSEPRLVMPA
jgi:hypothetical protein